MVNERIEALPLFFMVEAHLYGEAVFLYNRHRLCPGCTDLLFVLLIRGMSGILVLAPSALESVLKKSHSFR